MEEETDRFQFLLAKNESMTKKYFFYNCRIFSGNVYLDLNALSMYPPYPHDQCQTPAKGQMRGKALKAHRFLAASTRYVLCDGMNEIYSC